MPKRAILRVLWGKLADAKLVLSPGMAARIGREEGLSLSFTHDREMSNDHFTIDFDGEYIRLRDSGSATGTQVNGQPFVSGVVEHGAYIKAGETVFRAFIEGATPPLDQRDPAAIERAKDAFAFIARQRPLFGVFDAARDLRIVNLLDESTDEVWSLYEGIQGYALASVAPYLVRFHEDSGLLERLILEGWGSSWGVYFTANRPSKEIRRHLRRFLMVEAETPQFGGLGREKLYFRFYDPRVLRDFIPLATVRQRSEFFGDIEHFLLEKQDGEVTRIDPVVGGAAEGQLDQTEDEGGVTLVPNS